MQSEAGAPDPGGDVMSGAAAPEDEALSPLEAGRAALRALDAVLQQKPQKDDAALSVATQRLCRYRESLIEQAGRGEAQARLRLDHVNAVLSVVAAVHFPLGPVPWDALTGARDWLADLLAT
jgi:hypothetical protein